MWDNPFLMLGVSFDKRQLDKFHHFFSVVLQVTQDVPIRVAIVSTDSVVTMVC